MEASLTPTLAPALLAWLILVFGYLFLADSPPPAAPAPSAATYPATDCGPDPTTDDTLDCAQSAATCGV